MPSLTLSPVSLKDRTGAGSLTAPAFGFGGGVGWDGTGEPQFLSAGAEPELTHATETKAAASTKTDLKFFCWRNNMLMASLVIRARLEESHVSNSFTKRDIFQVPSFDKASA
jgi:hypothetical protein